MSYQINPVNHDYLERKKRKDTSSIKYPKSFKRKVDISKVNTAVIKDWIGKKLDEQLPDDDIVVAYICELLENNREPDIKSLHLQIKAFLGNEESLELCDELWKLLLSAQEDKEGIPQELVEERKKEMKQNQNKTNYNRSQVEKKEDRKYRERDREKVDLRWKLDDRKAESYREERRSKRPDGTHYNGRKRR
ncbi:uncharacterized protein PRCAT00005977001 [Priceomyces carsonii]|uniref:uncharacterized protein n=1 Tax=Priceomyces carsonii TaxID=28549 RepID=UPI002EDAE789|nr:unnamed protein product [Priceomyces carsonii]